MFGFQPDHEQRIKQGPVAAALPIIAPAVSAITSVAGLFMSKKSAPAAPQIEKPAVMPTPDDEAMKAAKRRSVAALVNRSGRQSTMLTDPLGDSLGA